MSCPACSSEPEFPEATSWHHMVLVPARMSVSQHGVLPWDTFQKLPQDTLLVEPAHGGAGFRKCPVSACPYLPWLMLKPVDVPMSVGSCQGSMLPSDLGAWSYQGLQHRDSAPCRIQL